MCELQKTSLFEIEIPKRKKLILYENEKYHDLLFDDKEAKNYFSSLYDSANFFV